MILCNVGVQPSTCVTDVEVPDQYPVLTATLSVPYPNGPGWGGGGVRGAEATGGFCVVKVA